MGDGGVGDRGSGIGEWETGNGELLNSLADKARLVPKGDILQSPIPDLRSPTPDPRPPIPDPRSPIPDLRSSLPDPLSPIPQYTDDIMGEVES